MSTDLRSLQADAGATFAPEATTPTSFGVEGDRAAWTAALQGVALYDGSDWGLLHVSGADCLQFLHNQTTNDIKSLRPGQGARAAIVNSTARLLDLAAIYALSETAWVSVSPGQAAAILAWFDRYIFPADRVELADLSGEMNRFSLIGPDSAATLARIGCKLALDGPLATHGESQLEEIPVRVAVGTELGLPGYILWVARDRAAELWQKLRAAAAIPLGDRVWEQLRLRQGRPLPGKELAEAYNPLEAGLWSAVSLDKGCYIGQETIARLNTYQGVKQRLWGIRLSAPAPTPPTPILDRDGRKIGTLTSAVETPEGEHGLAYVRTQAGGADLRVCLTEGVEGTLVAVPFLSHDYPQH